MLLFSPLNLSRLDKGKGGFSLIELLVAVTIIALVVGITAGVAGSLNSSRGMTAIHQVAALCDAARAKAMKGEGEVALAFATGGVGPAGEPFRAVLMCRENDATADIPDDLVAAAEWYYLPPGYVFSDASPASRNAGTNVLRLNQGLRQVKLPGDAGTVMLPCVSFGPLGEVIFPEADASSQGTLLLAIAEGEAAETGPQSASGEPLLPEDCRWIGLQRNSGASLILP